MGIFGCEGAANEHNTYDAALRSWADRGGRVFASHYSYTYLHDNGNFADTAVWGGPYKVNDTTTTGILDTSYTKGAAFNAWLGVVNAWHPTYGSGYIQFKDPRDYVQSLKANTERFVYTDASAKINGTNINKQNAIQQYSFNTPYGADGGQRVRSRAVQLLPRVGHLRRWHEGVPDVLLDGSAHRAREGARVHAVRPLGVRVGRRSSASAHVHQEDVYGCERELRPCRGRLRWLARLRYLHRAEHLRWWRRRQPMRQRLQAHHLRRSRAQTVA
ncbi:MAG: hypothetical protein QM756_32615 [Polyangiaceae bacterium]